MGTGIEDITISEMPVVKCKVCDIDTENTISKVCSSCQSVSVKLVRLVETIKGRKYIEDLLEKYKVGE